MDDLTIIVLIANKLSQKWMDYHKQNLLNEVGDAKFITVSYKPVDWGNNLIQTEYSHLNIYKQMLRAGKLATTPYVAIADDDTLYPREHFEYRPPMDKFSYNFNRWHMLAWKQQRPFYYLKHRPGNGCIISPRELMIKALERRFRGDYLNKKEILRELSSSNYVKKKYDRAEYIAFHTYHPIVSIYHQKSVSPLNQGKRTSPFPIQCFDLPKWGKAKHVLKVFNEAQK